VGMHMLSLMEDTEFPRPDFFEHAAGPPQARDAQRQGSEALPIDVRAGMGLFQALHVH
jgi:hypothetical protein